MSATKNITITGLILSFVLFLILGSAGIVVLPNFASAETVSVTAAVQEWVSFSVSPTTTNLGDLVNTSGDLFIGSATSDLTLNSNNAGGYSVTIAGANGGLKKGSYLISTPAEHTTTTCDISDDGVDAYGVQATSATFTIESPFNVTGNVVGSVASSTPQSLITGAYTTSSQSATLTVKASANKFDASGSYSDTLTLTATANP
jgi:hypothetical protein